MRFLVFLIMVLDLTDIATAMDWGEFNSIKPEVRQWFQAMRSPKGMVCCDEADGHRTQYDMRQDQYWVPINGKWYPVPPEAVIKTANLIGEAIVWYLPTIDERGVDPGSEYRIFCFIPMDGV